MENFQVGNYYLFVYLFYNKIVATLCKWKFASPIWTRRSLGISAETYLHVNTKRIYNTLNSSWFSAMRWKQNKQECIEHTKSCLFAEIPQSWHCAWLKWEVQSHIPSQQQTHSLIPTCWKPDSQGKIVFSRKVGLKWEWEWEEEEEEEEEGEKWREGKLKSKVNEERKKVDEKGGGTHMGCLDLSQTCRFLQRTCQGNLTGCAVMGTQELCCEVWIIHHHRHHLLLLGFCFCVCFFHIWIMK